MSDPIFPLRITLNHAIALRTALAVMAEMSVGRTDTLRNALPDGLLMAFNHSTRSFEAPNRYLVRRADLHLASLDAVLEMPPGVAAVSDLGVPEGPRRAAEVLVALNEALDRTEARETTNLLLCRRLISGIEPCVSARVCGPGR